MRLPRPRTARTTGTSGSSPAAPSRWCREAREQLPVLVDGELTGWSARAVRGHVRRCRRGCQEELARQEQLHEALVAMRSSKPQPPPELLDALLARTGSRGWRERLAVPARGAVSGARPALSVALVAVGAVASTGVGYGVWRGARAVTGAVRRRRS